MHKEDVKLFSLELTAKFDAAHYLPDGPKKCQLMHGHTWTVTVEVSGPIGPKGMIMDFADLKEFVRRRVVLYDHRVVNEFTLIPRNPTAENLADEISTLLQYELDQDEEYKNKVVVTKVTVQEGNGGKAICRRLLRSWNFCLNRPLDTSLVFTDLTGLISSELPKDSEPS